MTLSDNEKAKLKENCLAIKEYLIDLVKDCITDTTFSVDFFRNKDGHKLGISVEKRVKHTTSDGREIADSYRVYGYIGGLPIKWEKENYNNTLAWEYIDYGIELMKQWQSIKQQFITQLEIDNATRKTITTFKV